MTLKQMVTLDATEKKTLKVLACFFAIGLSMVACHLLIPETPVDMRQLCGDARASAKWKTYAELSPNERQFLYSDCSGY